MRNPDLIARLRTKAPEQTNQMTPEQQVWLSVYKVIAGYPGTKGDDCNRWANSAVERFNKRFGGK